MVRPCQYFFGGKNIKLVKPSYCFTYLCLDNVKMQKGLILYEIYFREAMLKHSVSLPDNCFQFKYLYIEFHIQRGSPILLSFDFNFSCTHQLKHVLCVVKITLFGVFLSTHYVLVE